MFRIKGRIDGLGDLYRSMEALKKGAKSRVARKMTNAGSTLILKAAKRNAKNTGSNGWVSTKVLSKSVGKKTKTYSKSGAVVAIIGPRKGFKTQVGTRKRGGKKSSPGDPIMHDPANVAHLVEFGHGGPHPAPAHPFLRPAFDEAKGPARDRMIEVGKAAIEAEAKRAAKA